MSNSKFKVGDVLINNNYDYAITIIAVGKHTYFFEYEQGNTGAEALNSIQSIDNLWMLKPKEVTITRESFTQTWDKLFVNHNTSLMFDAICKELGL